MKKQFQSLCICLLILLSACGNQTLPYDEEAIQTYLAFAQQDNEFKNAAFDVNVGIYLYTPAKNKTIDMNLSGKLIYDQNDIQVSGNSDFSLLGLRADGLNLNLTKKISFYIKDRNLYIKDKDTKIKQSIIQNDDLERIAKAFDRSTTLDEAELKKNYAQILFTDDSKQTVKLVYDTARINEESQDKSTTIEHMEVTTTHKDDQRIDCLSMVINAQDQKIGIDITVTFSQINQIQSITFPDFQDYVENQDYEMEPFEIETAS